MPSSMPVARSGLDPGDADGRVDELIHQMYELYLLGASLSEVGRNFSLAPSTVKMRFREAGLELRSYEDAMALHRAQAEGLTSVPGTADLNLPAAASTGPAAATAVQADASPLQPDMPTVGPDGSRGSGATPASIANPPRRPAQRPWQGTR